MREITITSRDAGQRFDKFLRKYFKEAQSSFLYKMLRKKNIVLNGKKADGREMLSEHDSIKVFFSDETFDKIRGLADTQSEYKKLYQVPYQELQVIHEDENILVLNKPVGLLSQKASDSDISINEMMLSYLMHTNALSEVDFGRFHPSVANRLDRNTSGLILAGKTLQGQQKLSEALKERTLCKKYHCIVVGCIDKKQLIRGYLRKDEKTNVVSIHSKEVEDSSYIETEYEPLEIYDGYTLLEVHLITGKSHQIRAHLSSIGHPLIGDTKYGNAKSNRMFQQKYHLHYQLLHSYSMEFEDGTRYIAEEPKQFQQIKRDLQGQ